MRRLFVILLILIPATSFAQPWRNRRSSTEQPSLSIFGGYRYGGTISAGQTDIFTQDVDIASSGSIGAAFDLPLTSSVQLELMASHQASHFTKGSDALFGSANRVANVDVTYYQAGVVIPFSESRDLRPYFVVTGGLAMLDPKVAGATSSNRASGSIGIGAKFVLSRNVGLRIEERGYWTSLPSTGDCFFCRSRSNDTMWQAETNLGLVLSF
jgi:hypothetical protein